MEQYIPKSALVAEIERRYETNLIGAHSAFRNGKIEALREVKELINTLEVKVDLDEEIRKEIDKYYDECEKKLYKMKDDDTDMSFLQLDSFAKHFFELGMAVNNKAQKVEEV